MPLKIVSKENLSNNFKIDNEKVKVNIDNDTILQDVNGTLKTKIKKIISGKGIIVSEEEGVYKVDTELDFNFLEYKSNTISLKSTVVGNTIGSLTKIPILTFNNAGLITNANEVEISHFQPTSLLEDYGFTVNSNNWNTAHGWGDHSLVGYLTVPQSLTWNPASGNLTISQGNTKSLDGRYSLLDHTHTISEIVDYSPYVHPFYNTTGTVTLSGAQVIDSYSFSNGHLSTINSRTLELFDLGYTGDVDANNYVLPNASVTVLGGIKVGANLSIVNGVLSANSSYVHPTQTSISETTTNIDVFDNIEVNTLGHVTTASKRTLPSATGSISGILTSNDWNTFNNKQLLLVSGTTLKTINGVSLLDSGDLIVGTTIFKLEGSSQFNVTPSLNDVTFEGTGDVSISFNTGTRKITIDSTVGAGDGSAGVTSFNGNTGIVLPEYGDYTLNLLGDIDIDTISNNQILKYNSTSSKWDNWTPDYITEFTNNYITNISFNLSDGILTVTRNGLSNITESLNGRYSLLNHTHLWANITDRPTNLSFFTNDLNFISENETITLTGDITGSGTVSIVTTLKNSGVTANTYNRLTVNSKGIVTGGTNEPYLTVNQNLTFTNGNLFISSGNSIDLDSRYYNISTIDNSFANQETLISGKQEALVSGTNIKTINNTSLLGSGNISITSLNYWTKTVNDLSYIDGKVMVGTAINTGANLTVEDSLHLKGSNPYFQIENTYKSFAFFTQGTSASTSILAVSAEATSIVAFHQNGKFTVGQITDTTSAKFQVNGTISQSVTSGMIKSVSGVLTSAIDGTDYFSPTTISNANYWTKSGDNLSYTLGKIGIGTATPDGKLNVVTTSSNTTVPALGRINSQSALFLTNDNTSYGMQFGSLNNGNGYIQQSRVDSVATGYDLLLNPVGGNVGIGTESPLATLEVVGTQNVRATVAGNSWITQVFDMNSNQLSGVRSDGLTTSKTLSTQDITTAALNQNTSSGYTQGLNLRDTAGIGWSSLSNWYTAKDTGLYRGGVGKLYVGNGTAGDYTGTLIAGNVGIGTTSPTKLLDVNGDALINGLTVGRGAGNILTNTAIGLNALSSNTTGANNAAIGDNALRNNTTGDKNAASGVNSLYYNTTGSYNTAIGYQSLQANTTGSSNTASGYHSLYSNTTGSNNVANGLNSLFSNTTGDSNVAFGYQSLTFNTTGGYNSAFGRESLYSNTTGGNNVASGYRALYSNTTGGNNTASGYQALYSNTTGSNNVASGFRALYSNTTGNSNVASGYFSLHSNTTGYNNVAFGLQALYFNTTGNNNVASGRDALRANTTGNSNVASGYQALYLNTTGSDNVASGYQALYANTTGYGNTAYGLQALYSNTTGYGNTSSGLQALYSNTTGINNTASGHKAGRYIADGATSNTASSNSVFFGYNTKPLADSQTNQIVIGYDAIGIGSNTVVLGNDNITTTILKGYVGIGTTSPDSELEVVGNINASGTITTGGGFRTESTTTNYSLIERTGSTSPALYVQNEESDGDMLHLLNGSAAVNTGTSRFVVKGSGRVGIGVAGPENLLHVNGTAQATKLLVNTSTDAGYQMDVNGTARVSGSFDINSSSPLVTLTSSSNSRVLRISPSNGYLDGTNTAVYLNRFSNTDVSLAAGGGQVGIGTTSPDYKLDVDGTGRYTGILTAEAFRTNTSNTDYNIITRDSLSTVLYVQNVNASGDILHLLNGSASANAGTSRFIVKGDGKVGIGTENPAGLLELYGAGSPTGTFRIITSGGGGLSIGAKDNTANPVWRLGTNSGEDLAFEIGGGVGNGLYLKSNGYVGIGITTPTAKLDVDGDSRFNGVLVGRGGGDIATNTRIGLGTLANNTSGAYNSALGTNALISNTVGSYSLAFGASALASNTTGNSNLGIGGWALFSNISGSDNLAIGINAGRWHGASLALTVASQSVFIGSSSKGSGNSETNQIVIGYAAIGEGSNSVVLGNNSISKTILKGNVGIGTTNPVSKFVASNGGAEGYEIDPVVVDQQVYLTSYDRTASNYIKAFSRASSYAFGIGSTEKVTIDSSGNVGIGITPTEKLHVDGTIRQSAVTNSLVYADGNGRFIESTIAHVKTLLGESTYIENQNNSAQTANLWITGNGTFNGTVTGSSDIRIKTDIEQESVLDKLNNINLYSYYKNNGADRQYGLIAQEVEKQFPYLISERKFGEFNNFKSIDLYGVASIALQGVKEVKLEIDILKEKVLLLEQTLKKHGITE
jgi:hypothetical protein